MSPSPILQALGLETRPAHDQLEQNTFNQQLTTGTITEAATVHFLTKVYGFLVPYEARPRHAIPGVPRGQVARTFTPRVPGEQHALHDSFFILAAAEKMTVRIPALAD